MKARSLLALGMVATFAIGFFSFSLFSQVNTALAAAITDTPTTSTTHKASPSPSIRISPTPSVRLSPHPSPTPSRAVSPTPSPRLSPIPSPSPSPSPSILKSPSSSPSPSSKPVAKIEGHVYLKNTKFGLVNFKIYHLEPTGKETYLTTTDKNGYYSVDDLTPDSYTLIARRDQFSVEHFSLYAAPKDAKNTADFYSSFYSGNIVYGYVTDKNNKPVTNVYVHLYKSERKNRSTTYETPDRKGLYKIENLLSDQSYFLKVQASDDFDSAVLAQSGDFTFPKGEGNIATEIDMQVNKNTQSKYDLKVITVDEQVWDIGQLEDAEVTLQKPDGSTLNAKSTATFKDLPEGTYIASAKKDGYTPARPIPILLDGASHTETIRLFLVPSDCAKHPQGSINEFWFCGDTAKADYDNGKYNETWTTIAQTIDNLRSQTGFTDLPQQVFIYSTPTFNASYDGQFSIDGQCPEPLDPNASDPRDGEKIIYTTGIIEKQSAQDLAHVTTHEFYHGVDLRRGGKKGPCQSYAAGSSPLIDLYNLARNLYASQFSYAIKDSLFDPTLPTGGHAGDTPNEGMASAAHKGLLHPDDSYKMFNNQPVPDELKLLLDYYISLVISGAKQ